MELSAYLQVLRRWWWLLVIAVIVGGAAGLIASQQLTPRYRAQATLLVVDQDTPGVSRNADLQTSALLADTFADIIQLRPIHEEVKARGGFALSVDEIRNSISVAHSEGQQLIRVTATATDPVVARDLANVLAEVFIGSPQVELITESASVTLAEPALTPGAPYAPNEQLNAMLAAALALLIALGVVFVIAYLDDTVQSAAEIADLTGISTLGMVPRFRRPREAHDLLQSTLAPNSAAGEAYRTARTNLTYALELEGEHTGSQLVVITSARPQEGKTSTSSNMAVVFGLAGHRVAIVDADLRRPMQHRVFDMDNNVGLSNLLLSDDVALGRAVRETAHRNVSLLASGPLPTNPSELLNSTRMERVFAELRESFDVVIIDSPPVLGVTDAAILGRFADAFVVVVRSHKTRSSDLQRAVNAIARTGRPVAGTIVNRSREVEAGYYYYGDSSAPKVSNAAEAARSASKGPSAGRSVAGSSHAVEPPADAS